MKCSSGSGVCGGFRKVAMAAAESQREKI